jgi:hypothetical protein
VITVLLDDNRLTMIAITITIMADRYANRPDPDASVFRSGR